MGVPVICPLQHTKPPSHWHMVYEHLWTANRGMQLLQLAFPEPSADVLPNPWPAHSFQTRRDWPYLGQFFCCAKVLKSLTVIAITLISQTYKIWFGKGKLVIISNNSLGFISTYHRVLLEVIIHFYWKLYIYTYSFYILQYIGRMKHRL